jgi:hypothetical protein
MVRMACREPQCLYSRAIPLLPLRAVRTVQSLSVCTVELNIYSPMGSTVYSEPQCLYSRSISLLPLWAVRPVQKLSACTVELYLYSPYGPYGLNRASVPVQYSYTPAPPLGRRFCTEPECLYSRTKSLQLLWAIRAVQNLCARTVELYLYSPYGPYGLYKVLVPVQYSNTSAPPMGQTACTEPQCL